MNPINATDEMAGEDQWWSLKSVSTALLAPLLIVGGLIASGWQSFILFHAASELFCVLIAWSVFMIAWNARRNIDNSFLLVLGIAYLCVGTVDLLHTLAYEGMNVFHHGPNLPTQLWIVGRYLEAASFLVAPFLIRRKVRPVLLLGVYLAATALVLALIFRWHAFPACYVEGVGLTRFKIVSEYAISGMLLASLVPLWLHRRSFDRITLLLLAGAVLLTVASEMTFTLYVGVTDFWNMTGHVLKVVSFFLLYRAIVHTAIRTPYDILFRDLKHSEERYRGVVEDQTELICRMTPDWRLTFVNDAFCRYSGRSRVELMDTDPLERIYVEDREAVRARIAGLTPDHPQEVVEHRVLRDDGTFGWMEWLVRALFDDGGELVEYQSVGSDVTERIHAQAAIQFSNRTLQEANRHSDMQSLLEGFIEEVKGFTSCSAVGIRILDEEGHIPYAAYAGFSQAFYDSECPLSLNEHKCMCTAVIKGEIDARKPFFTENGSFYLNSTTQFLATLSEEEKGATRNVCNRMGFESVALLPVRARDRILGLIHVADEKENRFATEIIESLEKVAVQLGSALERVWALENLRDKQRQLRMAHAQLEDKVRERTRELRQANRQLSGEVAQRQQLERQLLDISEEERRRIGRDLHDGLGQHLTGVALKSEILARTLAHEELPQTSMAKEIGDLVTEAISKTRQLSRGLLPIGLEPDSLLSALDELTHIVRDVFSIDCELECDCPLLVEDERVAIHLYRIVQEAVNNAAKHGRATRIVIRVSMGRGRMRLEIEDDGKGFEPNASGNGGVGLRILRSRADAIGGSCEIRSGLGKGTTVICTRETPEAATHAGENPARIGSQFDNQSNR